MMQSALNLKRFCPERTRNTQQAEAICDSLLLSGFALCNNR